MLPTIPLGLCRGVIDYRAGVLELDELVALAVGEVEGETRIV
jgi:hypothetical protein